MLKKQNAFHENFATTAQRDVLNLPSNSKTTDAADAGDSLQRSVSFSGNNDLEQLIAG